MSETRAAARYAKATLSLALEQKAAEAVEKDMRGILDTLEGSDDLSDLITSPIIKGAIKKKALSSIFFWNT